MANEGRRRQFGSIRKRSNGRYQVRYSVAGHYYCAPMTYRTKAEGLTFLATVETDLARGTWQAPRKVTETVESYIGRWIDEHVSLKESTRELYWSKLNNHIAGSALGRTALSDLTPDVVRTWYAALRKTQAERARERAEALAAKRKTPSVASTSDGSVAAAQTYRLLRAAMNTAAGDELIPRNPCRVKGFASKRAVERPTATPSEVVLLSEAVPPRYKALVLMAAWTGARLGELGAMRRYDLDLRAEVFSIRERVYPVKGRMDFDVPKAHASVRTVSLPPHLVPILEDHLAEFVDPDDAAFVFCTAGGSPIGKSHMYPIWARARAKVGLEGLRFHDLRHTGQTLAALAGATEAELMQRMGHSTTAASRIYMHSTADHSRAVAAALSEMALADNVIPLRPVWRRSS